VIRDNQITGGCCACRTDKLQLSGALAVSSPGPEEFAVQAELEDRVSVFMRKHEVDEALGIHDKIRGVGDPQLPDFRASEIDGHFLFELEIRRLIRDGVWLAMVEHDLDAVFGDLVNLGSGLFICSAGKSRGTEKNHGQPFFYGFLPGNIRICFYADTLSPTAWGCQQLFHAASLGFVSEPRQAQ
jgi:hypothetical protein